MMLNHLSERLRLPDGRDRHARRRGAARATAELHGVEYLVEFRLEDGLPVWRYEIDGARDREAGPPAAPAEHRPRHLPPALRATARVRLEAAAVGPLPPARRAGRARTLGEPVHAHRAWTTATRSRRGSRPAAPALLLTAQRAAFTLERKSHSRAASIASSKPRLRVARRALEPGYFRGRPDAGRQTPTLVASTELGDHRAPLPRQMRCDGRARAPRAACWPPPHPARAAGCAAELVLAADQFIITPAGRVEDAARAHAAGDEVRTVIAGYHWFTDWGRDTMISLEGLTLATGRHRRGRLHPAHLRPLRPRRPDPQHVPRGREARGSTTPPTPPLVLPRPRPLPRRDRRPRRP